MHLFENSGLVYDLLPQLCHTFLFASFSLCVLFSAYVPFATFFKSLLGTVACMNNVTISEEVRNAETLKNQLKYEKRATRLAETAVTSMASGLGGEGAEGDNNSGMVDASEIVLGLESGLSGAKAELAGKGIC